MIDDVEWGENNLIYHENKSNSNGKSKVYINKRLLNEIILNQMGLFVSKMK